MDTDSELRSRYKNFDELSHLPFDELSSELEENDIPIEEIKDLSPFFHSIIEKCVPTINSVYIILLSKLWVLLAEGRNLFYVRTNSLGKSCLMAFKTSPEYKDIIEQLEGLKFFTDDIIAFSSKLIFQVSQIRNTSKSSIHILRFAILAIVIDAEFEKCYELAKQEEKRLKRETGNGKIEWLEEAIEERLSQLTKNDG